MTDALIFDAVRTPRGRGRQSTGALAALSPVELMAGLLRGLAGRHGLDTACVDDVILGCVEPVMDQSADIARTALLAAGWDQGVAGLQINRFCASGLEAVALAAAKVAAGQAGLVVGGGVEMMSRIPMGSSGFPPLTDPDIAIPNRMIPQGVSADLLASLSGIDRHAADAYAVESQRRAAHAWAQGYFARSILPVRDRNGLLLLDRDEVIRADADMAALAGLEPSFAGISTMAGFDAVALLRYPQLAGLTHIHHAGNSSAIVDGAAAVLVGDATTGKSLGLTPRARIRACVSLGSEPTVMLTGPAPACARALARAGLSWTDIDLWELNEAFAAVILHFLAETGVDPHRMNVNGGAIAMGHPLGATGAMILGTLLDELERTDGHLGVATLCAASGMGIAMVIERI
ncbi:acetyl-CoA C-acetyltransferase [Niveispirillum sp.]|uniref:acetyl-CoA C-acetyltransferase n=1 Tax=Niveispirillum sp. TaxID=1917217 RepID=UPI001B3CCC34|nr:acetyl-CoA C-acetyltransferase [Niveispirillum sp.]MBP7336705.1 acetyl-CoA C-acetyltransferase [Niveispirillum sp.]